LGAGPRRKTARGGGKISGPSTRLSLLDQGSSAIGQGEGIGPARRLRCDHVVSLEWAGLDGGPRFAQCGYVRTARNFRVACSTPGESAKWACVVHCQLAEAHTSLASTLHRDWDFSGAELEFNKAIQLNPNYAFAHHWYAQLLNWLRRTDECLAESKRANDLGYHSRSALALREAERALQTLNELSKRKYVSPLEVAAVEAGLGQTDKAFASLERAYEDRSVRLGGIKATPAFDSLRSDPRYSDLVRRIGLPP
jgi:hypothetical protein